MKIIIIEIIKTVIINNNFFINNNMNYTYKVYNN